MYSGWLLKWTLFYNIYIINFENWVFSPGRPFLPKRRNKHNILFTGCLAGPMKVLKVER